jgi:hypothetical protein
MLSRRSIRFVGVVFNQRTGRNADNYYSYGGYYGANEHAPTTGKSGRETKTPIKSPPAFRLPDHP